MFSGGGRKEGASFVTLSFNLNTSSETVDMISMWFKYAFWKDDAGDWVSATGEPDEEGLVDTWVGGCRYSR